MAFHNRSRLRELPKALLATAVLVATMTGSYALLNRERIFLSPSSVVVYGTETCGYTRSLRTRLAREGIPYEFGNVDVATEAFELAAHMHMWSEARAVALPVVLYDGRVVERPPNDDVVAAYRRMVARQP